MGELGDSAHQSPAEAGSAAAAAAAKCYEKLPAAGYDEELHAASPDACDSSVPVNSTVSQQTAAVLPAAPAALDSSTSTSAAALA
jgi:hypothetical protein